jgi:hypothetical protein
VKSGADRAQGAGGYGGSVVVARFYG